MKIPKLLIMKYLIVLLIVFSPKCIFSQPSIYLMPYGGIEKGYSSFNSLENIQYFLYENTYDLQVNTITLNYRLINENCCYPAYFNIAIYTTQGNIIVKKEDAFVDLKEMPILSEGIRALKIKLDSTLQLKRGFYFIGLSRTVNSKTIPKTPRGCCLTSLNAVTFVSASTNGMEGNADNSRTKCYFIFWPRNSSRFPDTIPAQQKNISCYEDNPRGSNGQYHEFDTWYTAKNNYVCTFPKIELNN
jgi:hypothetical protein